MYNTITKFYHVAEIKTEVIQISDRTIDVILHDAVLKFTMLAI